METVQHTMEEVLINPRGPVQVRARLLAKDSLWRWVEGTFTNLIDDPDVGAIVANYRDITEQKAAEEKQQKDAEELARYNAELESFAYAATHDLREPLRTVSAFTQLLVQRTGCDEESEKYSKFILDSVAHMSRMLDDLLALTSLSSRMPAQSVDLRCAVEQAINYLEQAIHESGASITVGPLPRVLGNESQLTGLMQNLLGNAIKYRGPQAVRIEVTAEPMGAGWVVKVRDNGIGIAPAYHDADLRPLQAPAPAIRPRHRHRSRDLQENRRRHGRTNLGGIRTRQRIHFLLHRAIRARKLDPPLL